MSEYCMNCAAMSRERDKWKSLALNLSQKVNDLFNAAKAIKEALEK